MREYSFLVLGDMVRSSHFSTRNEGTYGSVTFAFSLFDFCAIDERALLCVD